MACIICRHFDLSVAKLDRLMELDGADFIDAVLDHIAAEAVDFSLLSDGYLSEIFKHEWDNRFCRRSSNYWPTVPNCLSEVRQSSNVIKMEVSDEDTIYHMGQIQVCMCCFWRLLIME